MLDVEGTVMQGDSGFIHHRLESVGASAPWFRRRLDEQGARIHDRCVLAQALRDLDALRTLALSQGSRSFASTDAAYNFAASAIGADFLTKAVHWAEASSSFILPKDRWKKLCSGDPIVTRRGGSSQDRNMTWETVIACLAATFATDVRFEEPDITCTFNDRRFAVAAKVAYSTNKLFDNIADGAKQAQERADAALVFVDVVELYPQVDTLRWSQARAFTEADDPAAKMRDAVTRWCTQFPIDQIVAKLRALTKKPVGIAFFVPMYIHALEAPRPFFYTHMPVTWGLDGPDYAFATAFLGACNRVLNFMHPG